MPNTKTRGAKDPDAPLARFDATRVTILLEKLGMRPEGGWTYLLGMTPEEVAREFKISKADVLSVLKDRR